MHRVVGRDVKKKGYENGSTKCTEYGKTNGVTCAKWADASKKKKTQPNLTLSHSESQSGKCINAMTVRVGAFVGRWKTQTKRKRWRKRNPKEEQTNKRMWEYTKEIYMVLDSRRMVSWLYRMSFEEECALKKN